MKSRSLAIALFVVVFAATFAIQRHRVHASSGAHAISSPPAQVAERTQATTSLHAAYKPLQSPSPPAPQALKSSADAAEAAADAAARVGGSQ